MPRDGNGNYTPPAGNPVVSNTLITSAWANDTVTDIGNELTDSLSRSGKGGLTAPLGLVDKSGSVPGLNFVLEPTTGLKREGAGDMRLQVLANDIMRFLDTNREAEAWNYNAPVPGFEKLLTTPVKDVIDANVKVLQIERLTTPGAVPVTLQEGELAVNVGDTPPKMWVGDSATNPQSITDEGRVREVPSGTKMLIYADDTTAPVGWTIDTAINEATVRVTSGSTAGGVIGGTQGGTYDFSVLFSNLAENDPSGAGVGGHANDESETPAHDHGPAGAHGHAAWIHTGSAGGVAAFSATAYGTLRQKFNSAQVLENVGDHFHTSFGGGLAHYHTLDNRVKWMACALFTKD